MYWHDILFWLAVLLMHAPLAFMCGCCGEKCKVGSDPLTADTLAADWTVVSGAASTASNDHMAVTASNSLVIFNTADAAGGVEVNASVSCRGANSGDQARLVVKESSASDQWYAQLTFGTSQTLKIFKVVSGTPTQLATATITTSLNTYYTLNVCYGNGAFTATITGVSGAKAASAQTTSISTQLNAGVGTGTITSQVDFKTFTYNHGYNASTNPTCTTCQGLPCSGTAGVSTNICVATPPTQWDVTLPGSLSAGNTPFSNCGSILGNTYTLTNGTTYDNVCRAPLQLPHAQAQSWYYAAASVGTVDITGKTANYPGCTNPGPPVCLYIGLGFQCSPTPDDLAWVSLFVHLWFGCPPSGPPYTGGPYTMTWEFVDFAFPIGVNCDDGFDLPFFRQDNPQPTHTWCDHGGSLTGTFATVRKH